MKFRIIASLLIAIVCAVTYWYNQSQQTAPDSSSDSSSSYKLD